MFNFLIPRTGSALKSLRPIQPRFAKRQSPNARTTSPLLKKDLDDVNSQFVNSGGRRWSVSQSGGGEESFSASFCSPGSSSYCGEAVNVLL